MATRCDQRVREANHTISSSKLIILGRIGTGAFGTVYKVHHKDWGEPVAYKKLEARFIDKADKEHKNLERELKNEADIHSQLHHRNVVTMIGIVLEPNNFGIVLEYATYGSLDVLLKNFKDSAVLISWELKTKMAYDISCGMSYLHTLSEPVVHGDLKIQNILVGDQLNVKISDFGLSKFRNFSRPSSVVSGIRGTPTHIPPEYWVNPRLRITDKFDVYSFAILLYEIYTEKKPFEDHELKDMIPEMVKLGNRPPITDVSSSDVPQCIQDLIVACWTQRPEDRPIFTALKSDLNVIMAESVSNLQLKDLVSNVLSNYNQLNKLSEHGQRLKRVYEKLCDVMRRTDEISSAMFSKKVLTKQEYDKIRSQPTSKETSETLINILINKSVSGYCIFLDALNNTSQQHLRRLLEKPDLPLNMEHQTKLTENFSYLKENVVISGTLLLDILLESKVLNQHEVEAILSKSTEWDKVDQLLHLILRSSPEQYQLFLSSLQQSNHDFVYRQLCSGDNLGHSETEVTAPNLDGVEVRRLARLNVNTGGIVNGVTQLLRRIYIVTSKSNRIVVYHSKTFARLDDIIVEVGAMGISQTMNAQDIVACKTHNCLYITDWNNSTVWQLTNSKGGQYLINWIKIEMYYRLSVMSDGRVLVIADEPPTIYIYGHDACLLHTVALPDDMKEPQYAVETTTGNFIVSHGWRTSPLHRVCEVSKTGLIIRSYGSETERIPLNYPAHITIDPEGHVYVADFRHSHVLLLDSTLSECKVLLSDDVFEPHRLFYSPDTRRLLVGQSSKPVVDVFGFNS